MTRTLWYVELEPLAARYTKQLCGSWFPAAFREAEDVRAVIRKDRGGLHALHEAWRMRVIPAPEVSDEISSGRVLDAVNRGVVSLCQVQDLLTREVKTGDVVYLQDFWTPGIEAALYSWAQRGIRPRVYARNFAQSVDEYDFTWPMRSWMRPIEVGLSHALAGMFVASTLHRDQLRAAGYACPIHVTGLPYRKRVRVEENRTNRVMFTSRIDDEKNPWFMLEVAREFLRAFPDWEWAVTTSARAFKDSAITAAMRRLSEEEPRFVSIAGLSKEEYYYLLDRSRIVFNSSLQDYVAFTMLEAADAGCDLCYPRFRSFPECVDGSRLYDPFVVSSAMLVLRRCVAEGFKWPRAPQVCDRGLTAEIALMLTAGESSPAREINVWHEPETSILALLGLEPYA